MVYTYMGCEIRSEKSYPVIQDSIDFYSFLATGTNNGVSKDTRTISQYLDHVLLELIHEEKSYHNELTFLYSKWGFIPQIPSSANVRYITLVGIESQYHYFVIEKYLVNVRQNKQRWFSKALQPRQLLRYWSVWVLRTKSLRKNSHVTHIYDQRIATRNVEVSDRHIMTSFNSFCTLGNLEKCPVSVKRRLERSTLSFCKIEDELR